MMDPDGDPATNDAPRVVNNSWGSANVSDRLFWDVVANWGKVGIVPVFAAGNNGYDGGKVGVPANFPHAFAVGAIDNNDGLAWFSSTGPAKWDGKTYVKPDVAAPGTGIVSAGHRGGWVKMSGTSMAAPHAAGLFALMLQANPRLPVTDLVRIARETAVDIAPPGPDNQCGAGRIDAWAAVRKVLESNTLYDRLEAAADVQAAERALLGRAPNAPSLTDGYLRPLLRAGAVLSDDALAALTRQAAASKAVLMPKPVAAMRSMRAFRAAHRE